MLLHGPPRRTRNVKYEHVCLASVLLAMACGPAAKEPEPATTELAPPATSAAASTTAKSVVTSPPSSQSDSCPLFCSRKASSCSRPKIADADLARVSCGSYSMGKLDGIEREPCPESCCRVHDGKMKGDDRDADGLFDSVDECPDAPEDPDGFRDEDGCPDLDNDKDGVDDHEDRCCYVAEDMDGKEDLDGCPE
jgi:hypothetical protein